MQPSTTQYNPVQPGTAQSLTHQPFDSIHQPSIHFHSSLRRRTVIVIVCKANSLFHPLIHVLSIPGRGVNHHHQYLSKLRWLLLVRSSFFISQSRPAFATMKESVAVQAFKSIASRIHPQLPLSPKESQRLLNALTSSFRQQLDHDHSPVEAVAPPASRVAAASSTSKPHPFAAQSAPQFASTDRHLASLLTSPLFAKPAHVPVSTAATVSNLKANSKYPIKVFEHYVSRGEATIETARLCLNAFRKSIDQLPPAVQNAKLREIAAGTRVLSWLWSSGRINAYSFAEDHSFVNLLAYCLVHEGNEIALWDLIQSDSLPGLADTPRRDVRYRKGMLLFSLVKAHLSVSPTAALTAFLRAVEATDTSSSSPAFAVPAGVYLSKELVQLAKTGSTLPEDLYNRFVDSCHIWAPNPQDRNLYRVALLKLHHPVSPTAIEALAFIRRLKETPSHPFLAPQKDVHKADVYAFFFDTARLLHVQGFGDDAAWVLEFMRQTLQSRSSEPPTLSAAIETRTEHRSKDVEQGPDPMLFGWKVPSAG